MRELQIQEIWRASVFAFLNDHFNFSLLSPSKPKKQEAFYESHRMELTHYEAAERYLNAVMNGKTSIPLKAWKSERDKLSGEKKQLTRQYYALKDEVKEVEQICRNVYSILREENGREQPTRKHEIER